MVDLEHDVALLNSRVGRRAVGLHAADHHALAAVEVELIGDLGRDGLHLEAPVGARLLTLGAGEFLFLELGDLDLDRHVLAVANHLDRHALADWCPCNELGELMLILHRHAVELDDYVAAQDTGLERRTLFLDVGHQRAFGLGQVEGLGEVRRDFLDLDSEPSAHHLAMLLELLHHLLGYVDRNREADPGVAAGAAVDGGIDADDLPLGVEQWAARVARVNRRVGLDEVIVVAAERAPLGADNPGRDGRGETERAADCDYPVADLRGAGLAQRSHRQRLLGVNLDERKVGFGILADHLCGELALVEQPDADLIGVSGHVVVGQNVTVGRYDHARAQPVLLVLMGNLAEKAAELIERVLLLSKRPAGTLFARSPWSFRSAWSASARSLWSFW